MSESLLESVLRLETVDETTFRSREQVTGRNTSKNVFGGQLVAQSISAALETLPEDFFANAFHCNYVQAGDATEPIYYEVEKLRDGWTYKTRSVRAKQNDTVIFAAQISSCAMRADTQLVRHQDKMPIVPLPCDLDDGPTVIQRALDSDKTLTEKQRFWMKSRLENTPKTFEIKPVEPDGYLRLKDQPPKFQSWIRAKGRLGDSPRLHHCAVAYISDSSMVGTALLPHCEALVRNERPMLLSLDHSIWIHDFQFRADQWMLYDLSSSVARDGRGWIQGSLWTDDGRLVASTAQEAMLRIKAC